MEEASSQSQSQSHGIELHLKSLTLCDQKLHHNSCIMASNLMSPPPSPGGFSHIGDYIGMESCLDMRKCEDVQMMSGNATTTTANTQQQSSRENKKKKKKKKKTRCVREFPPPITLLARTENLPSHMPFVLRRYYTNDGRLILREERVRHHEYFRAHRSNGHLTLQLVPLGDDDDDHDECALVHPQLDDENENESENALLVQEEAESKKDEEGIEETIIAQQIHESSSSSSSSSNENETSIGGMCLSYNNVIMSSSCYLGVPVPAIKPVPT